jgi:ferric-dicitrate binding protein FerR (iron transport regulator)
VDDFLKMLWNEIEAKPDDPSFDQDAVLEKIRQAIKLQREKAGYQPHYSDKTSISAGRVLKQMARVAAILLVPVMMYLAWEVLSQRIWLESQKEVVYNEIVCPLGARSHFELPDGTTGSLNNGSRLKYPVKFHGDLREVELQGEAYFNVKKNKRRPFIINTHGLDVKVTGTRLNVYSYPEDQYQEFTLESGSMELLKKENNRQTTFVRMKPGQHAVYQLKEARVDIEKSNQPAEVTKQVKKVQGNMEKLETIVSQMKPEEEVVYETDEGKMEFEYKKDLGKYTAWREGMLVLRNDPMPLLLKRIERWYHVEFNVLDEEINEYTYWATFEQENLNQVLELLTLTGPIRFRKHERDKNDDGVYEPQVIDVMLKK